MGFFTNFYSELLLCASLAFMTGYIRPHAIRDNTEVQPKATSPMPFGPWTFKTMQNAGYVTGAFEMGMISRFGSDPVKSGLSISFWVQLPTLCPALYPIILWKFEKEIFPGRWTTKGDFALEIIQDEPWNMKESKNNRFLIIDRHSHANGSADDEFGNTN